MPKRGPGQPARHATFPGKTRLAQVRAGVARFGAWLYAGYVWTVFAVVLLLVSGIVMLLRNPRSARGVARAGARLILRIAGVPFSAQGLEKLPPSPHLLLVNHASFVDSIALTAMLPAQPGYAFAVRQEFPAQRLLCPLLRRLGTVVLANSRRARRTKNVARIAAALRRGNNLLVFPEGGFVRAPGLKAFHSGAFVAAAKAGVPIVIAGLRGARAALPPRTWLPRRVPLVLEIGPVFTVHEKDPEALAPLIAAARKAMMPLAGEPDAVPPAPSVPPG